MNLNHCSNIITKLIFMRSYFPVICCLLQKLRNISKMYCLPCSVFTHFFNGGIFCIFTADLSTYQTVYKLLDSVLRYWFFREKLNSCLKGFSSQIRRRKGLMPFFLFRKYSGHFSIFSCLKLFSVKPETSLKYCTKSLRICYKVFLKCCLVNFYR